MDDLKAWRRREAAYQRRKKLKEQIVQHLGGKCRICGYDRCMAALHVHHIDEQAKSFDISSRMSSWKAIAPELDKCVLLCATCHAETHDGMHPHFLTLDTWAGHGAFMVEWFDDSD